jgi:hypothetical protein
LKFQELSATHLGVIRGVVEATRGAANQGALGLVQQTMSARVGTRDYLTEGRVEEEETMRLNTVRSMERAERLSGEKAGAMSLMSKDPSNDEGLGSLGKISSEAMGGWAEVFEGLAPALIAPVERIKKLIESGDKADVDTELNRHQQDIRAIRSRQAEARSVEEKQVLENQAVSLEAAVVIGKGYQDYINNVRRAAAEAREKAAEPVTSGATLGAAVEITSDQRSAEVAAAAATEKTTAETPEKTTNIHLEIDTVCSDCGNKIRNSQTTKAVIPGEK